MVEEIIKNLKKEEVRFYKLFAQRTNGDPNRKDLALFDAIRKGKSFSHINENALYRLRNRLSQDLNLSLYIQHLKDDPSYVALQYLFLAQTFKRRSCPELAHKFLKKALKSALQKEEPAILNSIYSEFILLSHELTDIDLETYIQLRKESEKQLKEIQEIDNVLAVLTHRIKTTQSFSQSNFKLKQELESLIQKYSDPSRLKSSLALRLKIYKGVIHLLLREKQYLALSQYLEQTYISFDSDGVFNRANHPLKLEMIIYSINSYFKLSEYQKSLSQASLLESEMEKYGAQFKSNYLFYLYNARIINYSATDPEQALKLIDLALETELIGSNQEHNIYLQISKAQLLHQLRNVKSAIRTLARLVHSEVLDAMPENYVMKVELAEIMLRFEQGEMDFLEKQIPSWTKKYGNALHQEEHKRELLLSKIILNSIFHLDAETRSEIKRWKSELFALADESEAEDLDVLNYVRWVKKNVPG